MKVYPDFPTGGIADFSHYNDGQRGGKIKVRARIEQVDSKLLKITEENQPKFIQEGTHTFLEIESGTLELRDNKVILLTD